MQMQMHEKTSTYVGQSSESILSKAPPDPSSPISITFESCWAGQSWQRCCPVRAQRLRISHHPAGLSTLCHPPNALLKSCCRTKPLFFCVFKSLLFAPGPLCTGVQSEMGVCQSENACPPCKVQLVPEDIPSWSAHDMSRSIPILDPPSHP